MWVDWMLGYKKWCSNNAVHSQTFFYYVCAPYFCSVCKNFFLKIFIFLDIFIVCKMRNHELSFAFSVLRHYSGTARYKNATRREGITILLFVVVLVPSLFPVSMWHGWSGKFIFVFRRVQEKITFGNGNRCIHDSFIVIRRQWSPRVT